LLAQELFTALLINPVANLETAGKDNEMCDITVADILGPPLFEAVGPGYEEGRDANFALLSYSYSLVGPGRTSNSG